MQKGTDIDVQLERLSAYRMRGGTWWISINIPPFLWLSFCAGDAKQHIHPKASFLSLATQTMRGYLDKDPKQFVAYFLALFAEKEYAQVLDRMSKVDKSLRGDRSSSQFPPGRSSGGLRVALPGDFLDPVLLYAISVVFQATLRLGAFAVCPTSVPAGIALPFIS